MISVVIPNYNGIEHLKDCFDSLRNQSYKDFQIILVDNNSSDNSIEFTKTNYPEIIILQQKENTGFAKAVNCGIKLSLKNNKIKHILLLNNDIECDINFAKKMLAGFISDDVGSVTCKMLNFYKRNIIDAAGDFIKRVGSPYARGHSEIDEGQYDKPEYVFGACAGAAIYRKEIFEKIGFFDEDFFAYYEDVDFSLRLQLTGFKCYYNPEAICYHKRGATSVYNSDWQTQLCEKNLIALRIKNYPASLYFKLAPLFLAGRVKRYYVFLREHSYKLFMSALRGYFLGLFEIPKSLKKRITIQRNRKINVKHFKNLLS
ncbi:MAG TPA: glycosyltransferase family 2 protein [Ignavibacteria bacterium]